MAPFLRGARSNLLRTASTENALGPKINTMMDARRKRNAASETIRRAALAEARIVGCDDMVAIGERRNEVAEHVGRSGEAMQQQHGRSIGRACLAIEDVYAVNLGRPVAGHS